MKKSKSLLVISLLALTLLATPIRVQGQLPPGILRGDIYVVSADHAGRIMTPTDFNIWKPGVANTGWGLCLDTLFAGNISGVNLMPALAESIEYSSDYKKVTIHLRSGIYWSDGVEFTADDVVYTIETEMNVTGLTGHTYFTTWVDNVYSVDKYTVVIELKKPNPKFHVQFMFWGGLTGTFIMPKHIFEKVDDVLSFEFFPPVGTGPYVLKDYDPQGYWTLWERREDWERSSVGKVVGKPQPKYVLYIHYGGDDKEINALARHELDVTQIGYESLDVARAKNPFIRPFWGSYPYAWMGGVCSQTMQFNVGRYPYNITDVRWALALAINITDVWLNALGGAARLGYDGPLAITYMTKIYDQLMLPWLENFTLPDGYKPWDPNVPDRIANYARNVLHEEVTRDIIAEIVGRGWWKYDPEKATQLLEAHGFYKDTEGKWHLPDGSLWTMNVITPAPGLRVRVTTGVTEQWRGFGIEVNMDVLPSGALWSQRNQIGDYDVSCDLLCANVPDVTQQWQGLHKRYYKPEGEVVTGGYEGRWVNDEVSNLLDEMNSLPLNDPRTFELAAEVMKILIKELPIIYVTIGSKMIVYDTYVWTNVPTGENNYGDIQYWSGSHMAWFVFPFIKHTGNVPFTPEELTPTTPGTSPETIEEIQKSISEALANITQLKSSYTQLASSISDLQNSLSAQRSQIDTLMLIVKIEGILIIVALIAILIRKR